MHVLSLRASLLQGDTGAGANGDFQPGVKRSGSSTSLGVKAEDTQHEPMRNGLNADLLAALRSSMNIPTSNR